MTSVYLLAIQNHNIKTNSIPITDAVMNSSELWSKSAGSKTLSSYLFNKYGHFLQWKDRPEDILEIGCADGSLTKNILLPFLGNRVKKIVAIDKSQDMINYAKKHYQAEEIDYRLADAMRPEDVENLQNSFDHIFIMFVAHWIPDTKGFLQSLRKVSRPEAQIFMVFLTNRHSLARSFENQAKDEFWSKFLPKSDVFADYTDEPVRFITNLLEEVGFSIDVCDFQAKSVPTENFSDFIRSLMSMYDHLHRIPAELQGDLIQYHINNCKNYCAYLGEPDIYEMSIEMITSVATKKT